MALDFPKWLVPRDISFHLENVSRSGGVAVNGQEQVVSSASGRWVASLVELPVSNANEIREFRALMARLHGRAGTLLVPAFDGRRANWPIDAYGRVRSPGRVRHKVLDGTVYQEPAIPTESQIVASLGTAALRRATTVQINVTAGSPVQVGQYFSPRAGKLHLITEALGGNQFRIEPPLRVSESGGTLVNFMTPTCEMRLTDDDGGRLALSGGRRGSVSLEFEEAF